MNGGVRPRSRYGARDVLGRQHPDVSTTLQSLGYVLHREGKWGAAEAINRDLLRTIREQFGPSHWLVDETLINLGTDVDAQGRPTEGLRYYQQALEIRRQNFPHDSAQVAQALLLIAGAHRGLKEYPDAVSYSGQALEVLEKIHDPHVDFALREIGRDYMLAGRPAKGEPYLRRALELRRKTLGRDHPDLATAKFTLADCLVDLGRYDEAAAVLEPLCEGVEAEQDNGEDCDGLVAALLSLAEIRRRAGDFERAQSTLDRAGRLAEAFALHGPAIDVLGEQAELYAAQGCYREAYETLHDFHRADVELRAAERDSRAQTLQAIFEAAEARRSSDYFRELSVRDPLTGLLNRRYLDEAMAREIAQAERGGQPVSFVLIDLDHFKRVNDLHGHLAGDRLLSVVADTLTRAAPDAACCARIGGDEFAVILPETDLVRGLEVAERLRAEIAAHDLGPEGRVTASLGVAELPACARTNEELRAASDAALYEAKRAGRDRAASAPVLENPAAALNVT